MFVPVGDGIDSDRVRRVAPYAILSVSVGDKNSETTAVPANASVTSSNLHGVFCDIADVWLSSAVNKRNRIWRIMVRSDRLKLRVIKAIHL
jgi:hypothetical protein